MTKLTNTQVLVLTSSCQNDDGLATRPTGLRPAAATKLVAILCEKGFVKEIRAKRDAPVWREDEEGRFALKILKAGRAAVEGRVGIAAGAEEVSKTGDAAPSRAGADTAPSTVVAPHSAISPSAVSVEAAIPMQAGSKRAEVIALLSRPEGAAMDELIAATGWLPHTTRAALSGLRKAGFIVERSREGQADVSTYRIVPARRGRGGLTSWQRGSEHHRRVKLDETGWERWTIAPMQSRGSMRSSSVSVCSTRRLCAGGGEP